MCTCKMLRKKSAPATCMPSQNQTCTHLYRRVLYLKKFSSKTWGINYLDNQTCTHLLLFYIIAVFFCTTFAVLNNLLFCSALVLLFCTILLFCSALVLLFCIIVVFFCTSFAVLKNFAVLFCTSANILHHCCFGMHYCQYINIDFKEHKSVHVIAIVYTY